MIKIIIFAIFLAIVIFIAGCPREKWVSPAPIRDSTFTFADTVQIDTVPVPVQSDKVIAPDTLPDSIR